MIFDIEDGIFKPPMESWLYTFPIVSFSSRSPTHHHLVIALFERMSILTRNGQGEVGTTGDRSYGCSSTMALSLLKTDGWKILSTAVRWKAVTANYLFWRKFRSFETARNDDEDEIWAQSSHSTWHRRGHA